MTMSMPALPGLSPIAQGNGWVVGRSAQGTSVHILRDDGLTFLGMYMDAMSYNRAKLVTTLNASAGITAAEQARLTAAQATNW